MKLLVNVSLSILFLLAALGSISWADVIVAEDFWYSQPTKAFGPGGGFGGQDYGGGQNGPAGQWNGRWVSFGDGIITGSDITEDGGFDPENDMFQAATRNGLSVNWLDRDFQLLGLAGAQTVYFGVSMRSNSETGMPVSRMIIHDAGGNNQISMGLSMGGFVGSLGETEELLEGPGLTEGLDPHTLIGKLEIDAIGSDERLTVWLDPTDAETAENSVQVTADVLTSLGDITGTLRLDHNFSEGVMFWDDVALGTAWEDVAHVSVPRGTLLVDTDKRETRLQNTTGRDLDLTFYQIISESGALTDRTWTSLADQGFEGWMENNPTANSLTESRFEGSTPFADGSQLDLGQALRRGNEDLGARMGTADGLLNLMNVEYGAFVDPILGDCNGDGVVDATDLACICGSDAGAIDDVLAATGLLAGDLDANGTVAFSDFLVLSASFGQAVNSYTAGDINCDGQVAFADFLLLSANFGQSGGVMAAAVPEPSGLGLVLMGLISIGNASRPRKPTR